MGDKTAILARLNCNIDEIEERFNRAKNGECYEDEDFDEED